MGIQPLEKRQKRGMNIENTAFARLHELFRENAHEARQHDEIGVIAVNDPPQFLFEGLAVGVERVIHSNRVDSLASGRFKTLRERTVRDHGGDPGRNRALPLFGAGGFENGLEVRAASGNKDDDIFHNPAILQNKRPEKS